MGQQLVNLLSLEIDTCYSEVRLLLLQTNSYKEQGVKAEMVDLLIRFIESGTTDTITRIVSLGTFIYEINGLLSDGLSPLCFLTEESDTSEDHLIHRANKIKACLEVFDDGMGEV